jgi:putative spermidine/putrescine transport system substrate-binding protein
MVADGVKPNAVPTVLEKQTGALDRAFAKLDTIKDDIVFWSAGSQPLELVKSGEVVMAIAYNGRVGAANLAEGENFEYIWEGQVLDQEYLCLMTGAPNRDVAVDFMMHASTPEAQAEQAKYITYGPMRASGIPIIQNNEPWGPGGVDIMPHMPNTPERLAVSIVSDPQWWSDNGAEINERYAAWMGN